MIPSSILAELEAQAIHISAEQQQRLAHFSELISKWNKTYNLTAIKTPQDILLKHIVDSLVVLPNLKARRYLDVGSGGGLPGIPLAIMLPDKAFTLLDTNSKKTRFIRQAVIELGLENVQVVHQRVEKWSPPEPFDAIISRAFASLPDFVTLTRKHLTDDGRIYAMKGKMPEAEIRELPEGVNVVATTRLHVPSLDAERYLIEIELP